MIPIFFPGDQGRGLSVEPRGAAGRLNGGPPTGPGTLAEVQAREGNGGSTTGKYGNDMGNIWKQMGILWEEYGKSHWEITYGNIMGMIWEMYRKI